MDKRIIKTKKNIKKTMTMLLKKTAFEDITVTELCKEGEIGRITFYTYYDDKYALIDEMFHDYIEESTIQYRLLQSQNNPDLDPLQGYSNLLSSILDLFDTHMDFFNQTTPEQNPYLYTMMYRSFFTALTDYIQSHGSIFPSRYPSRLTAALICNGLCGVLGECQSLHYNFQKTKETAMSMYGDMLHSPLFSKQA